MRELLFILTTSAGQITLTNAPDGWDESLIQWERSDKYWGVFRSFTIPLKFVKTGATAIRTEFYTYGTAGTADLVIQRLNKITLNYTNAYVGKLDFGTFRDTDNTVEVNLVDSGLAKILKDNGGTEYEVMARIYGGTSQISFRAGPENVASPIYGGINITDLIKRILDKMTTGGITAGTYGFKSDLLTAVLAGSDHSFNPVIICKGRTFREGGTIAQGNYKTSFEDIFKSLVTWTGCGVRVEVIAGIETLVIEPKSYFFDSTSTPTYVGSARNVNISVNPKLSFNRLMIGFPAKEYQDYGMNYEPNATSKWKTPNDTSTVELDMVSKFRADKWGVTQLISSQDDSADDDIFFMELYWSANYGGGWWFNQSALAKQTGYTTEWAVGNDKLTPRRCLLANQTWLESCLYLHAGGLLEYVSGDNDLYNIEVKQWISGTGFGTYMKERLNLTLTAPSIFKAVNIEFEAALPYDMIDTLNTANTSLISFKYEGNIYTGFVMSVKVKLSGRGSQKITLLSSAANDLTQLIR